MRFFNTAGPVRPDRHYCVPPLSRLDLDDVLALIRDEQYFVLHAPRQTGKTSALLALRDLLNGGAHGNYRCVYANVEAGQAAREDKAQALRAIIGHLGWQSRLTFGDEFVDGAGFDILARYGPDGAFTEVLSRWAHADSRPLVLILDEIDALVGDTLLTVLRQLRAGYPARPKHFPQSVILCGVRDVRDYRIHARSEKAVVAGGSAFNVKAASLRLGDFSRTEVLSLLAQHTTETGQAVQRGRRGSDPDPVVRSALAGQRAGRGGLLREPARAGPRPADRRGRRHRGAGTDHRAARDASGPTGGQASGGPRAARGRAAAERR